MKISCFSEKVYENKFVFDNCKKIKNSNFGKAFIQMDLKKLKFVCNMIILKKLLFVCNMVGNQCT